MAGVIALEGNELVVKCDDEAGAEGKGPWLGLTGGVERESDGGSEVKGGGVFVC